MEKQFDKKAQQVVAKLRNIVMRRVSNITSRSSDERGGLQVSSENRVSYCMMMTKLPKGCGAIFGTYHFL